MFMMNTMASPDRSSKKMKAEEDVNEDILMLILLMLPPKSIFRFRCVSKLWNNIISAPFFLQSYRRRKKELQCLLAFIQTDQTPLFYDSDPCCLILPMEPVRHDHRLHFSPVRQIFINASNGLILACAPYKGKNFSSYCRKCNILNPLTGKRVSLPDLPSINMTRHRLALVCQENTQEFVASYKVIVAKTFTTEDKALFLTTYSSKSNKWTSSTVTTVEHVISLGIYPVVLNGIVHWWAEIRVRRGTELSVKFGIVAYDSNRGHVQQTYLPNDVGDWPTFRFARSSRDDEMWFGAHHGNCVKFWMLPKGSSATSTPQWILKYSLNRDSLAKDIMSTVEKENGSMIPVSVPKQCTFLALIPWKPHVAVLRIGERIFLYDMESKFVEQPKYQGHPVPLSVDWACHTWVPYLEPFCLSSYGL